VGRVVARVCRKCLRVITYDLITLSFFFRLITPPLEEATVPPALVLRLRDTLVQHSALFTFGIVCLIPRSPVEQVVLDPQIQIGLLSGVPIAVYAVSYQSCIMSPPCRQLNPVLDAWSEPFSANQSRCQSRPGGVGVLFLQSPLAANCSYSNNSWK